MKTNCVFSKLIVFVALLSISALAEKDGGLGPVVERPPDYSVSENYFVNQYFRSNVITDTGVLLHGHWTDTEAYRLSELLKQLDGERESREASIREYTDKQRLVFKVGYSFGFSEESHHFRNPGAIYGVGISSMTELSFQIPMTASDQEIKDLIRPHLPIKLIRDQTRLKKWQKNTGRYLLPGICASLLSSIGLR